MIQMWIEDETIRRTIEAGLRQTNHYSSCKKCYKYGVYFHTKNSKIVAVSCQTGYKICLQHGCIATNRT